MRAFALLFVAVPAAAQPVPPCSKELTGILFDFGTPQAPRLFKCDGRTWTAWVVPPALCAAAPASHTPAPTPAPASVDPYGGPQVPAPTPAPASVDPFGGAATPGDAPPPMPPLEPLAPLPTGPTTNATATVNPECRRQCTVAYNTCVRNKCGTSLAASCRQSCDRSQTKCVTGCP